MPRTLVMGAWPFAGRDAEIQAIRDLASEVDAVLITGPAGIGKTTLARRALVELGGRSAWVAGTRSAAAIPFGAVAHLASDDADPTPAGLLRDIAAQVRGLGSIGVDDAHLMDDSSSAVIADLVRRSLVFVVMTARSGEPLSDALAALGKDGHARCLELKPLPSDVIEFLIDAHCDGTLDGLRRRRLCESADGNPLALRELLLGGTPGGLTELAASRLSQLDSAARRVAELVACAEPIELAILEGLADPVAIAAAEESGLVVVGFSGARAQARMHHPIYGDVLRATMSRARARHLWRGLSDRLLATPLRRRDDSLRVALWQVNGGRITRPDLVREGAAQAIGRADLGLAERLARAAQAAEPGAEVDRLLAEILEYRGKSEEAAALLTRPADRGAGTNPVMWAITRAESRYWGSGDVATAERILDTVAGEPLAAASRSWIAFFDGRPEDSLTLAREANKGAPLARIWAAASSVSSAGFLGRCDEVSSIYDSGRALALEHKAEMPYGVFEVDVGACLAHLATGDLLAAEAVSSRGYDDAVADGVPMMVAGWSLYRGLTNLARGHAEKAEPLLRHAVDGFTENDTFRLSRCSLAALAATVGLRGDAEEAARLLRRVDRLPKRANRIFEPWILQWRAWAVACGGDLRQAAEHAARGAHLARELGLSNVESQIRCDLVRLGAYGHTPPGGDELIDAAKRWEASGHDLLGAEAALAAARCYHRQGSRTNAGLAAALAGSLRARCGNVLTPMLRQAGPMGELSPREREVVLLAAQHSSREIGHRLGLAVSTINNNLARAYAKLGVNSRKELRSSLVDNGPD